MKITDINALMQAAARAPEEVEIKSLGGAVVRIKHLTAAERDQHEASVINSKGEVDATKVTGIRQRLVALTLVNEEGKPVGSAAEIAKLPAEVVDEIAEEAARINGMRAGSKEEAGNA